jgi:hypothetical protein
MCIQVNVICLLGHLERQEQGKKGKSMPVTGRGGP